MKFLRYRLSSPRRDWRRAPIQIESYLLNIQFTHYFIIQTLRIDSWDAERRELCQAGKKTTEFITPFPLAYLQTLPVHHRKSAYFNCLKILLFTYGSHLISIIIRSVDDATNSQTVRPPRQMVSSNIFFENGKK
jgi:hypothetical protein